MNDRETQARLDALHQVIAANIVEYGVHLVGVFPRAGTDDTPTTWTYTIGLTYVRHPEIVVFGLPYQLAGHILNSLSEKIRSGRLRLEAGTSYADEDLAAVAFRVVRVRDEHMPAYVQQAINHYPTAGVEVLQLVWPDKHGAWPDDPEWSLPDWVQPVLW